MRIQSTERRQGSPGNPAGSTKSLTAWGIKESAACSFSTAFTEDSCFSKRICSLELPSDIYLFVTPSRYRSTSKGLAFSGSPPPPPLEPGGDARQERGRSLQGRAPPTRKRPPAADVESMLRSSGATRGRVLMVDGSEFGWNGYLDGYAPLQSTGAKVGIHKQSPIFLEIDLFYLPLSIN